jgi:hypothetical protein
MDEVANAPEEISEAEVLADVEALLETVFLRALTLGQAINRISIDPTREETLAFVDTIVGKIWDDYQVFKNSNDNEAFTEATIIKEEHSETPE